MERKGITSRRPDVCDKRLPAPQWCHSGETWPPPYSPGWGRRAEVWIRCLWWWSLPFAAVSVLRSTRPNRWSYSSSLPVSSTSLVGQRRGGQLTPRTAGINYSYISVTGYRPVVLPVCPRRRYAISHHAENSLQSIYICIIKKSTDGSANLHDTYWETTVVRLTSRVWQHFVYYTRVYSWYLHIHLSVQRDKPWLPIQPHTTKPHTNCKPKYFSGTKYYSILHNSAECSSIL